MSGILDTTHHTARAEADIPLTVFFPFYNEETNIEETVNRALRVLPKIVRDFEIIVVDDGSRDRTAEIGASLCRQSPHVRMVRHDGNQGYGAALVSGIRAARKEWVFFMDGDGQFNIEELAPFLRLASSFDAVLGYRLDRKDPLFRKVNAGLWKNLIRALFDLRVRDIDCAFKLFRRQDAEKLELESRGAFISVELLAKLKKMNVRWTEMGVHHYPRQAGHPTGARLSVIVKAFDELFRLRKRLAAWQRPLPSTLSADARVAARQQEMSS